MKANSEDNLNHPERKIWGVFLFLGYLLFDLLKSVKSQDTESLQDINEWFKWLIKTINHD